MKTILVAGGAGFVGSNLCKTLLENGDFVICMDDITTGRTINVSNLPHNNNFKFVKYDITRGRFGLSRYKLDQIYNLASPASPPAYQADPIKTIKTNVIGTMKLLEFAQYHNASFLQASTSEIYGNPLIHPQPEEYYGNVNTVGPRSCYDEAKRMTETLCYEYGKQYDLDYKIIRIFNTYGPNMDPKDGRVVSNFINQALKNENITIYGNGSQTRSFCYVDDLVNGIIKMMNSNSHGPINLGNPGEFTIGELAKLVIELTNSKSKIEMSPLPQDDPLQRKPVIEKAKKELGWEPTINLQTGLVKTIDYFSSILNAETVRV